LTNTLLHPTTHTAIDAQEAAMELLTRALQYNNQKRLYLAALGIFQRTERAALCEQVLKVRARPDSLPKLSRYVRLKIRLS
jgi:hypothetical protein